MTTAAFGTLDLEYLGRLVDQLPVLLWSTDEELRVTSRRGGGLGLLVDPPRRDEGLRVGEGVSDPADAARVIEAHRAALGGKPTTYEIAFQGRAFSARVEPMRDADGRICGVVGVAVDGTHPTPAIYTARRSEEHTPKL